MKDYKIWLLGLCFAVLTALPFLADHAGAAALVGVVPLLIMEARACRRGVRRLWPAYYAAFVLWNALTTFWVCNATFWGGVFTVLANAAQMALVFALFRWSKKHLRGILPYLFLATMWLAWEKRYYDAEVSWPWLTFGNAFARSPELIQWYEFTGVMGGSLWVWACNLGLFGLYSVLRDGRWKAFRRRQRIALIGGLCLCCWMPVLGSVLLYANYREAENPVEVLVCQPNFDPYEKFGHLSQAQQNDVLEGQIRKALEDRPGTTEERSRQPLLIVAPETFTSDIVCDWHPGGQMDHSSSPTWQRLNALTEQYANTAILFGAATVEYWNQQQAPSPLARNIRKGLWYTCHNSAYAVSPGGHTEFCHKSKLVPGTEKMPWPEIMGPIDEALGGVMARDVPQEEPSVFRLRFSGGDLPVGCPICYESIYGDFCRGYIKKGAQLLCVMTNDAWWGDTPGYIQHLSYSRLRAIETRRSIARSANTGISALIGQRGEILSRTTWAERTTLRGTLNLNSRQTFFVRHGDICGRIGTFVFLLLILLLLTQALRQRREGRKKGK